jgi:hypothetical protein
MKVFLLHRDRDFDLKRPLPPLHEVLIQDLELKTLFEAMAGEDKFLWEVAQQALLSGLSCDVETIRYRQEIAKDCLKNPSVVRDLYRLSVETLEKERRNYFYFGLGNYPGGILSGSVSVLEMLSEALHALRRIADLYGDLFTSEGFRRFFDMIKGELDESYFELIEAHLQELHFKYGVLMSARLGQGNRGTGYVLHRTEHKKWRRLRRLLGKEPPVFEYRLHPRDEAGARALSELRDQGIALVAVTISRSMEHVLSFFRVLRTELAFYVGMIVLHDRLRAKDEPTCFPEPGEADTFSLSARGLYDACLSLRTDNRAVGNEIAAVGKQLLVITGANQGGKSTFLRSLGLAQLMMQSGLFVAADSFEANLRDALFTHYKREEDATMSMGKFEEELKRMSDIVDHVTPRSMVLFNESFASTNEREGSEIATQIVSGLMEKGIKVGYVTHMHELARGFYDHRLDQALFLRADRKSDGTRTFKLIGGKPLQTSYGADVYREVFGEAEEDEFAGIAAKALAK